MKKLIRNTIVGLAAFAAVGVTHANITLHTNTVTKTALVYATNLVPQVSVVGTNKVTVQTVAPMCDPMDFATFDSVAAAVRSQGIHAASPIYATNVVNVRVSPPDTNGDYIATIVTKPQFVDGAFIPTEQKLKIHAAQMHALCLLLANQLNASQVIDTNNFNGCFLFAARTNMPISFAPLRQ